MDYELISYALGLAIFGGFVWAMAVVSFNRGLELGKRMAVAPVSRPSRAAKPASYTDLLPDSAKATIGLPATGCKECGLNGEHAYDCPNAKPKPDRRRWMGFSRIKAELENKESENVATQ